VNLLEPFDGSRQKVRGFVNQIRLTIAQRPRTYESHARKVALVGSLLKGDALTWFSPLYENSDPVLSDFESFIGALRARFDDPHRQRTAAYRLQSIRQGRRPTNAYATEFQLLLSDAGWDDAAAMHTFKSGLNGEVKDLLLSLPRPTDLANPITQAIECDERLYQRRLEQRRSYATTNSTFSERPSNMPSVTNPSSDPMQLDSAIAPPFESDRKSSRPRLEATERQRRINDWLCLYCGQGGHVIASCPLAKPRSHLQGNVPGRR